MRGHGARVRASARSRSPWRWPTPIPATSSSIAAGIAWFVDLEKVHVGSPAIDLAHATLADLDAVASRCRQVLSRDEVQALLRTLSREDRDGGRPTRCEPWLLPMRRLTWLRTTLFMARWRVQTRSPRDPSDPAQWSDAGTRPAMKAHIDARIDQCFRRDTIQSIRAEWTSLTRSLFVLRVGRTCGRPFLPTIPTIAIPEPVHRGRGALSNESSRFDEREAHSHDRRLGDRSSAPEDDELPPLRTTLTRDATRTIIARNTSPDVPSTARSIPIAAASTAASTASRGRPTPISASRPASISRPRSCSSPTPPSCSRPSSPRPSTGPTWSPWAPTPIPTSRSSAS